MNDAVLSQSEVTSKFQTSVFLQKFSQKLAYIIVDIEKIIFHYVPQQQILKHINSSL